MTQFIFESYTSDVASKLLSFNYILRQGEREFSFTETLILSDIEVEEINRELLHKLLQTVHLVLGLSYWKLYTPQTISIKGYTLSIEEATFWNTLYTRGLGEFFYHNSLDFRKLVQFPFDSEKKSQSYNNKTHERYLVGVGGGKDSILTSELLKKHQVEISGFVVETQKSYPLIDTILEHMRIPSVRIKRIIDPQLFSINKQPDVYNGHIPISAVYGCIGLLASGLYGYDGMITSNERSANYGNVEYLNETINHQWSKSREFEVLFQQYIHASISPDLRYFSLLRPYSEYTISELFSQYRRYFPEFSSCNRNFNIISHDRQAKWCGTCPKCAFVFALLSAFIPKKDLRAIFNANLYENKALLPLYKELLGVSGFKPFECVGTPEEMRLAMLRASENGEYKGAAVMEFFEKEIQPDLDVEVLENEVTSVDLSILPEQFKQVI